jgi:hypothetical protein
MEHEAHLQNAAIIGWSDGNRLVIATPVCLPAVVANRLSERLARGLSQVLGRPARCLLARHRDRPEPPAATPSPLDPPPIAMPPAPV